MNIVKVGILSALSLAFVLSSNLPSMARNGEHSHARREARFDRQHPRRSEVLDRRGNLNRRINSQRGNLDGHYGQLKHEDNRIRRQEQRDARINGGYITPGQKHQLNREENHLRHQIKRDQ